MGTFTLRSGRAAAVVLTLLVAGCGGEQPTTGKAAEVQKIGWVCEGVRTHSTDIKNEKSSKSLRETRYFSLGDGGGDLLTWDRDRGSMVSVCHGWGHSCTVEAFPLRVEVKGALSNEERLDIDLYRKEGRVIVTNTRFEDIEIFAGDCREGHLPSADLKDRKL